MPIVNPKATETLTDKKLTELPPNLNCEELPSENEMRIIVPSSSARKHRTSSFLISKTDPAFFRT